MKGRKSYWNKMLNIMFNKVNYENKSIVIDFCLINSISRSHSIFIFCPLFWYNCYSFFVSSYYLYSASSQIMDFPSHLTKYTFWISIFCWRERLTTTENHSKYLLLFPCVVFIVIHFEFWLFALIFHVHAFFFVYS